MRMRKEDTVPLNSHFVLRRIEVLGLKQWWLARELGVSEKTVNRWLTGRVKRVARYNAESLARQLGCRVEDVILPDETDVYATREEQRVAAGLLQERDLLGLLSPSDNWALAESLIKATMQPDLPLGHLGRLYNLLKRAVKATEGFPIPIARLLLEGARLAAAAGDAASATDRREKANAMYRELELPGRVVEGEVREHGEEVGIQKSKVKN